MAAKLAERGYLTELPEEREVTLFKELAGAIHESSLTQHATAFVIIPTYMCNLRCPYCWQSTEMHIGAGGFSAVLTCEQTDWVFAAIDRFRARGSYARTVGGETALESSADREARKIVLFGGEPLLAMAKPVVGHILSHARRRGMRVSAITNGVELDHYTDLLGPDGISDAQITLDGPADTHDRRRIGPNYRTTFERITHNIQTALECDVQVTVRINVDRRNMEDFSQLEEFFAARGWTSHPRFYVQAATVHSGTDRPSEARHLISSSSLVQITSAAPAQDSKCIESYEYAARQIVSSVIGAKEYPFRRSSFCAAESGMMIFDPMGDIYACWEDAGDRTYRTGAYGPAGVQILKDAAEQWLSRFPGAIEECSVCPYGLIHVSGCAAEARRDTGSLFAPSCQSFQDYFPKTLARVYQETEDQILRMELPPASQTGTQASACT